MMKGFFNYAAEGLRNIGGGTSQQISWQLTQGLNCVTNRVVEVGASDEHPMSIRSASDGSRGKAVGLQAIVRFTLALFLCLFFLGVGKMWADEPDWASMGDGEIRVGMGFMGEYYLYNVGADAFLGEGIVTSDPHSAKVYTMVSTFNDLFELEGESIYYTDGSSVNHFLHAESVPCWTTDTKVVAYQDQGNNQYRLYKEMNMGMVLDAYLKIDAGSLTLCTYYPDPMMAAFNECALDASCNWVFIPKADFETALASLPSGDPEPEPEEIADGFYYLYNVASSKYFTGMINASGLTDDNAKAALFYVSKVENEDTYKFAYMANRTSNGSTTSASYTGINVNSNTGVGLIVEKSNQAEQQKLTIESIEGTNNVLIYRNINEVNRYLCYDATNNKPNVKDGTSDNNCKWILKPAADFKASVTAAWTSDTYAQKAVAVSDKQFYYLYNPATGAFIAYNGSSASLNTNPKMAEPFYVIKSGDNYLIKTEKTNGSVVFASPNWNATSTPLTLTETEVNGKKMYSIVDNSSSVKKSITLCKNRSAGSTNSYFNYIQTTLPAYPYTADVAATDILGIWVLIPKSEALNAPDAFDPSDTWAAKGTTELSAGGQFYLYNPATKTFAQNSGLATAASGAYLYTVRPLTGANEGKFELTWPNVNAYTASAAINYLGYNSNTATSATQFTLERIGETNHYRIYYDLMGTMQYYVTTKRTAISGDVSTYSRFYNANYGENSYIYTPDGFSEWILIPDSEYEQVVTPKPSPEEEDVLATGGKNPQNAGVYKMYNVGAKRFLHYETMTDDNSQADDCTIGRDGSSSTVTIQKDRNGTYTGYYLTTGGHNSTAYELTIEEVDGHPGQYYVYKTVGNYDIHLRASWSNATKYASEAIRSNGDKATLSDKCRWVFLESKTVYYKAKAEIYAGEGTLKVAFASGDVASADDKTDVTSAGSLAENLSVKVYLKAEPASGYQFMGWKIEPDGAFVSTEAEFTYTEFTVSSTDSEHPDNVTLYAYFEKYDAELYNENGILVKDGDNEGFASLASAIAAASKGYTIKLKRNITSEQTINKGVTIDFNGYTISGSTDNLVTISAPSADAVTFVDNSIAGNGGVSLEVCTTSVTKAINVTSGTLVINSGYYTAFQCWNHASTQAYVINRTGGSVRVNGGYFRSYSQNMNSSLWSQKYQKYIFNGSNIKLYGGYYAGNCDELQELYKYNDTYTLPIVSNNVGLYVGEDMELVNNPVADSHTDVYIYKVQSAFDEASVVATANGKKFTSLADAIAYANNNAETTMVIRLAKDCSLPAGTYTIPAKATLIVPYNAMHTEPLIACPLLNNSRLPKEAYRTLTLENGVHVDVFGAIELGGCAYSYGNGATGTGRPNSDYGHLIMNEGSQIVLNKNAHLRAWGFVTGSGTIDVRRGAKVHEMFQVYDFKGGNGTLAMYRNTNPGAGETENRHSAFPVNQYFIQNVEVKTTYRPGSELWGTMAAVNTGIAVKIIGVNSDEASLFMMDNEDDSEDTWVCKWYNPTTDQQVYDINNSAQISNLILQLSKVIGVAGADFDSKEYKLPITNNMKIHLLSGDMRITQDVAFLPGAELEINKLCTGHIDEGTTTYLYDTNEWGAYVYNGAYASKIKYRPGGLQYNRNISSASGLSDAKVNIHGTVEVNGSFRTTAGGANIFSTNEDAGTLSFTSTAVTTFNAGTDTLDTWSGQDYHPATEANGWKASATPHYVEPKAYPAKLQNASGFTETQGTAVDEDEIKSFCYIGGEWILLNDDGACMVDNGEGKYYIKPREYVQLSSNEEDDITHLYHNVDNTRDFILTSDLSGNCQWWEVTATTTQGIYHCVHPENDVYYVYENAEWVEKRFSVTWRNWDGSKLTFIDKDGNTQDHYEVRYGAKPQWLGEVPSREMTDYYTYDFAGWSPAITEETRITSEASYTAQFIQTDRKYLITFKGGGIDTTEYKKMGEIPFIPTPPSGKEWTPAVGAVTGDAEYTLKDKNNNGPFTITFVNWDGIELQSGSVEKDAMPEYSGATPVKPSLGDENYTFVGWTPTLVAATADAVYMVTFEASHVSGLNISSEQTITDERVVTDLRVTTTGSLTVSGSITADNLYLESNGVDASGQIKIASNSQIIATNAYFDFIANVPKYAWLAVAVPWQVDATSGISVNGRTLGLGRDFDLIYYDGATRAANGKGSNWAYVEDDGNKTMQPGRLYMIAFNKDIEVVRFAKKAGTHILTERTSVTAHPSQTGNDADANWNGVANPALYHAYVNPGIPAGQVYNSVNKSYDPITLSEQTLVVGQGVFVQAPANKEIIVSYGAAYAAPRRNRAAGFNPFDVRIAPIDANYTDRLFVLVDDEKEEESYTIGQDLAKVGVSKQVAQMWINRYNAQLCMNTIVSNNGVAEYPLGISAPKAGEYAISVGPSAISEQYALYLTRNGEAIWNLNEGAYILNLNTTTDSSYGLRAVRKNPQDATGLDEAVVDAQGKTQKMLIDNKVYIIRNGKVYSVDGQLVR